MFKVVVRFKDLQDNNHIYNVGDEYPRKGAKPTEERIKQLSSNNNLRGQALIQKVEDKKEEVQDVNLDEIVEEVVEVEEKPKKKKKK